MKFNKEYNTIVIVGNWNNSIFNPQWVSKYLLIEGEVQVEIPININGSYRFTTDNLRLFILDGKLNITILKQEPAIYDLISELVINIANYLPHTPVSAFGVNFQFTTENSDELNSLFTFSDSDNLNQKFIIHNENLSRNIKYEDNSINLNINKNIDNFLIDINFHFEINDLTAFKSKFNNNSLVEFKEISLKLLKELYNLESETYG